MRTCFLLSLFITISIFSLATAQQSTYAGILADEFPADGPGATAIVTKGDKVLYHGATGMADLELDLPMKPENILRLGSITKQFTAVCILHLQEAGKLDVRDEITRFLPDYPTHGKEITIEHLLTHTSGIMSYTNMPGFMENRTRNDLSVSELIDVFKNEPMEFDPGDSWNYNNSGYILLGAIIEKASGMTYEEYLVRHVFKPLGLENTHYGGYEKLVHNRASGYTMGEEGYQNARFISMTLPYAAGSLIGTVRDLYKWNEALWDGKVISKASLKKAHTPYVLNNGEATNYGYGWSIGNFMGEPSISHGGGIFGFTTQGMYLPESDVFVAVYTNCDCQGPNSAANRLAAIALGKSLEFEPMSLSPGEFKAYEGVYEIEGSGEKRAVYLSDGRFITRRGEGREFEIQPYAKDKFFYPDTRTTLVFERGDEGRITGHTINPLNGTASFARLTDEPLPKISFIELTEEQMARYAGSYELGPNFILKIWTEDGKMFGQASGQGTVEVRPVNENTFVNQQFGIKLIFDTENAPASFLVLDQGGQERKADRIND